MFCNQNTNKSSCCKTIIVNKKTYLQSANKHKDNCLPDVRVFTINVCLSVIADSQSFCKQHKQTNIIISTGFLLLLAKQILLLTNPASTFLSA